MENVPENGRAEREESERENRQRKFTSGAMTPKAALQRRATMLSLFLGGLISMVFLVALGAALYSLRSASSPALQTEKVSPALLGVGTAAANESASLASSPQTLRRAAPRARSPRVLAARETGRALVGAIRWDGWYRGSPYVKNLAPKEWRYRLPFYAKALPNNRVEAFSDSQTVMDQEIAYAAANGIDYWIFNMFILRDPQGRPIPDATKPEWKAEDMNRSRTYYLSSTQKSKVKFSLMLSPGGTGDYNYGQHNWDFQAKEAVTQMREPSYQKVLGGRPLVFLWLSGEDPDKIWGSWGNLRNLLDGFRQKARGAGLKNPYIVAMVWSAEEGTRAVNELGADAVTAYTGPLSEGYENTESYTQLGYDRLTQADRTTWEHFRAAGLQAVPTASTGWDPRPHRNDEWGYPGGYKSGPVVEKATPAQIAAHVKDAVQWVKANPAAAEAKTAIVYAWNELSEGGWIIPTLAEGDARLRAIGAALKNR